MTFVLKPSCFHLIDIQGSYRCPQN